MCVLRTEVRKLKDSDGKSELESISRVSVYCVSLEKETLDRLIVPIIN